MTIIFRHLLVILIVITAPLCSTAQACNVGFVKSVSGEVCVISSAQTVRAALNMGIMRGFNTNRRQQQRRAYLRGRLYHFPWTEQRNEDRKFSL